MTKGPSKKLIESVTVALEITNTQLSDPALEFMLADLCRYPEVQVLAALMRCCRELKPRQFTLEAVLSRIDDGRPDPEGAWASIPKDEEASVVWTTEMHEAWTVAFPLIQQGQFVPARMAFKERYTVVVQQARDARFPVQWEFSPGTNKDLRELVLLDAAEKGRISADAARRLLPHHRADEGLNERLLAIAGQIVPALAAPGDAGKEVRAKLRERIRLGQPLKDPAEVIPLKGKAA